MAKTFTDPKTGKFAQGNPGGPGRPPIPEFVKGRGPDAWQKMLDILDGKEHDEHWTPGDAADWVVCRLHGKAPAAPEDDENKAKEMTSAAAALLALAQASTKPKE